MSSTVTGTQRGLFALPRLWRLAAKIAAALAILVIVFYAAGGWYFASQIDHRALSGEARSDSLEPKYRALVVAVSADTVTLRQPGEKRLSRDGVFGIAWDGGWGTVGSITSTESDGAVTREFHYHAGAALAEGMHASLNSHVYQGDPLSGLGIPFEDVRFDGPLGQYPAWYVRGDSSTWFIFVHGNGMRLGDALRIIPAVSAAGFPILVPTYRNDPGAPEDPSGRLSYGKNEWHDLEAAVRYALDHGAQSVVIEGVSMGGAVTVAFLLESPLAEKVSGVVLESPLLDFDASLEYQARSESLPLVGLPLPGTLVDAAQWIAARRFGVDWNYTNYLPRLGGLKAPMLLIHGADDEDVPVSTSGELAKRRPDLVTEFWIVPGAAHVEGWNARPAEYERRVVAFLAEHADGGRP